MSLSRLAPRVSPVLSPDGKLILAQVAQPLGLHGSDHLVLVDLNQPSLKHLLPHDQRQPVYGRSKILEQEFRRELRQVAERHVRDQEFHPLALGGGGPLQRLHQFLPVGSGLLEGLGDGLGPPRLAAVAFEPWLSTVRHALTRLRQAWIDAET